MQLLARALLIGVVFVLGLSGQNVGTNDTPMHLEGVVVDGITGKPVSQASISIDQKPCCLTDAAGRFGVNLSRGPHVLQVDKRLYRTARLEGRRLPSINLNRGIPISVGSTGKDVRNFVVRLFPPAVATGRVYDHRGQPMQDAEVVPYFYAYNDAGKRYRIDLPSSRTDDLGRFRVDNLDAAEYFFEIRPAAPDLGGNTGLFLAPIFYPGVFDPAKAEAVALQWGADCHLGNFTAVPVRSAVIHAKVVDQTGQSHRGTAIFSVYRLKETASLVRSFPGVPIGQNTLLGPFMPGSYFIRGGITTGTSGLTEARLAIELGEGESHVDLHVLNYAPAIVTGRALVETASGARPLAGVKLAFYDLGPNPLFNLNQATDRTIFLTSESDGFFPKQSLNPSMPPYGYRIRLIDSPGDTYVAGFLGANPIQYIPEPGKDNSFTVVLRDKFSIVEGSIVDRNGVLVRAAVIALIPDDPRDVYRTVTGLSDIDGAFYLKVAPGNYHLYAWREMIGAAYFNEEFIRRYQVHGVPVRVGAAASVEVRATVLED